MLKAANSSSMQPQLRKCVALLEQLPQQQLQMQVQVQLQQQQPTAVFKPEIPKTTFKRVVQQMFEKNRKNRETKLQTFALECLHQTAETFIIDVFDDAKFLAQHRNRSTIKVEDKKNLRDLRFSTFQQ